MAQYTPLPNKALAGALADDGDLDSEVPKICVDYLSHQWAEEDVWRSWRSMTRAKYEIANGMRLENASWRTWWKQRNKLKTISPENLNWLKDSDVTWLYGPLHQAPSVPPTKIASTADKIGFDLPKSNVTRRMQDQTSHSTSTSSPSSQPLSQAKPILKKRSVTDILAMGIVAPRAPHSSSSPVYEAVTAELEGEPMQGQGEAELQGDSSTLPSVAGILKSAPRPALWHTKSDSILARQAMLSTSPMSVDKLSPPGDTALSVTSKSASRSPPPFPRNGHRSDSSSSYQVSDDSSAPTKPKRHISFNSFVEQRRVVDPPSYRLPPVDDGTSSDSDSDDEDGTVLEMRSLSGSSLSSSRRGSINSQTSSDTHPRLAGMTTMITAPIAPTLLKEPDDLPAPSPAVVFVAPQGIDEETLKYEIHVASKAQFSVPADRRRLDTAWTPPRDDAEFDQMEVVDYFSGVPVPEPDRESIYTDEDEDAITVRRRIRSPRSSGYFTSGDDGAQWREGQTNSTVGGPTPDSSETGPLRSAAAPQSSFASEHIKAPSVSPPTVSHDEIAGKAETSSARVIVPRSGSASNLPLHAPSGIVSSAPRSSHLTSALNSHGQGRSSNGRARNRPRGASFEGVDMRGETSALSGRSKSSNNGLVRSQSAAAVSPARESPVAETRGRSQRISEELERPRRGRSLLRTNSSSTISERERSSTTASTSPLGSLSPRSTSSVGIVGGYISPANGIGSIIIAPSASLRSSSSLRFESGSWTTEDERKIDSDLVQIVVPSTTSVAAPVPESPVQAKPATSSLVRTSSSTNIPAQTSLSRQSSSSNLVRTSSSSNIPAQTSLTNGIRRTNSSSNVTNRPGGLQRTSSSSNIAATVRPSPQLITSPVNEIPSVVLQPSSRRSSLTNIVGIHNLGAEATTPSPSTSLVSQSPESTGSFWRANELESPATPPSPADKMQRPPFDEPSLLQRELSLKKSSIKPRASGLSLASSTSNGSNSSNTTVVPGGGSKQASSQLASASSSASSTTSGLVTHRRSSSRSSHSAAPSTPPPVMRTGSSSITTRHVTQAVARAEMDSISGSASQKHLKRLSGGIGSPVEEKSGSGSQSPPVSPGSVLSNVVGSARGLFDALWGNHDHSS